jgi:hypothetical protein
VASRGYPEDSNISASPGPFPEILAAARPPRCPLFTLSLPSGAKKSKGASPAGRSRSRRGLSSPRPDLRNGRTDRQTDCTS